uniref:DRBM domain-containing protein n=1 Tax=Timema bartmani TaxID=61472 RepID=A0A7R9I537_9NEOP|nr:unnamed protein product [Timema bartmani]
MASWSQWPTVGSGHSKKEAKHEAAKIALERIKETRTLTDSSTEILLDAPLEQVCGGLGRAEQNNPKGRVAIGKTATSSVDINSAQTIASTRIIGQSTIQIKFVWSVAVESADHLSERIKAQESPPALLPISVPTYVQELAKLSRTIRINVYMQILPRETLMCDYNPARQMVSIGVAPTIVPPTLSRPVVSLDDETCDAAR